MNLYVRLRRDEVERLVQLAADERRRPADQAAILIAESLDRRQVSEKPTPAERHEAVMA